MEQEIADSIGVIEAKRKEQEKWSNSLRDNRTFAGTQMVPYRDKFGEFIGCEAVKVYRE